MPEVSTWHCRGCFTTTGVFVEWPCMPAKDELVASMRGTVLSMYLAAMLECAAPDLAWLRRDNLYERFCGWARPALMSMAKRD